jgi:hypothetical protein
VFYCRQCDIGGGGAIDLARFLFNDCDFPTAVGIVLGEHPKGTEANGAHKANGKASGKSKHADAEKEVVATYRYMDVTAIWSSRCSAFTTGSPLAVLLSVNAGPIQAGQMPGSIYVEGIETIPYRLPELFEAIAADRTRSNVHRAPDQE